MPFRAGTEEMRRWLPNATFDGPPADLLKACKEGKLEPQCWERAAMLDNKTVLATGPVAAREWSDMAEVFKPVFNNIAASIESRCCTSSTNRLHGNQFDQQRRQHIGSH